MIINSGWHFHLQFCEADTLFIISDIIYYDTYALVSDFLDIAARCETDTFSIDEKDEYVLGCIDQLNDAIEMDEKIGIFCAIGGLRKPLDPDGSSILIRIFNCKECSKFSMN